MGTPLWGPGHIRQDARDNKTKQHNRMCGAASNQTQSDAQDTAKNERAAQLLVGARALGFSAASSAPRLFRRVSVEIWTSVSGACMGLCVGVVVHLLPPSTCGPNRPAHFGINSNIHAQALIRGGLALILGGRPSHFWWVLVQTKLRPPPSPVDVLQGGRRGAHMSPFIDQSEPMDGLNSMDLTTLGQDWAGDGA